MRILIAEDERITRRSLQRQLEGWGYEVVAVEDGVAAWEAVQREQFDIVVTDWDMPNMDGRDLIQRIRGSDATGYVYLIMLTGRSEKTDVVAGMEAGADDFVAKPFDRHELRARIDAGERIIRLERELAARNEALAVANDRMKHDLDAAARVQHDLLPGRLPENPGAGFAWHFQPCDELGGDILNVLSLDDRHVAMYLLDVTGHGVAAALLSVTLSRVITARDPSSSFLVRPATDGQAAVITAPHEVIERLNRQFPMRAQGDRFFTMAYAVLDVESRVLRYTLAGQPPPILVRPGEPAVPLDGSGFPVGVVDGAEFDEHAVQLQPGDRLYFYSDGITEAANGDRRMLGTAGFLRLIDASLAKPLADSVTNCIDDLQRWCHPVPFDDDVSLLALEVRDG